ncbi:pentapeptide repeat-containing protein [Paracoccus sp. IB05]|uniref:pentapeptide repeat-containing protein n=1 Tax=Paracoccus sp. IB05 TaxID=2779367 RepID=UPI0018E76A17|nr:pentapeptide repeat-containing protein [Paracoccus sp. IB05]MBJ2151005.1 pentapeptide repeat-containing protein [Paracoccus sp. IB05]
MTNVLFTLSFTWELLLLLAGILAYTLIIGLALWWFAAKRPGTALSRYWTEMAGPLRLLSIVLGAVWLALILLALVRGFALLLPQAAAPRPVFAFLTGRSGGENIGTGALIVAILGSPLVIWATMLKHRTVSFQKEGHMTDRISKAVEQLGAEKTVKADTREDGKTIERTEPNIEVRVGGLLSLERIAEDSMRFDTGRDHIRVMQIICAYLRQNSPMKTLKPSQTPFSIRTPRLDLQIATDVLCRRTAEQRHLETNRRYRLELSGVDFDGMTLTKGDFTGALMIRCRFEAAYLDHANLTGARLHGSLLNFANLAQTVMRGTHLDNAVYTQGNFLGFAQIVAPSVTIQGANMSALRISDHNAMAFFGSRDTVLNPSRYSKHMAPALRAAEDSLLREPRTSSAVEDDVEIPELPKEYRMFSHWNLYTAEDLAAGEFLIPWQKHHNLTGWPFSD